MYWKNNPASNWDSIFDREDLCLGDLMREENLLEELKGQNKKLIDFLTKPDIALELVRLVTQEKPLDNEKPEILYVLPNLACEILTSDIQPMYNVLSHEEEIWKCFFSFLEDNEPPLNSLMASYFSRTLESLILKTGSQDWYTYQFNCLKALEKVTEKGNFIDLLLKHLDTSAIMDLIIKISTLLEGPSLRNNIFLLFEKEQLIFKLVDTLDPKNPSIRQLNAAEIICAIEMASDLHPLEQNPLVVSIESPETVNMVLVKMFGQSEKTESTLLGGIAVVQTLLMATKFKGDDSNEESIKKQSLAEILCITILPFLEHIHNVLVSPPMIESLESIGNVIEKPFGNVRLQIVKLISSLLSMHNQQINERFAQLNTIKILLDCFFYYELNNFLHTQVVQCFHEVMCYNHSVAENSTFIAHVIKDCKLIESILDNEKCIQPGKKRKGYIGHLVAIAKSLHNTEAFYSAHFRGIIVNSLDAEIVSRWDLFTSTTLEDYEERTSSCLGGGLHPRDEIAIQNARKAMEENEAIYERSEGEFNSNDNHLGNIRVNFEEDDDEEDDKDSIGIQAEIFNRMCSVMSSEVKFKALECKNENDNQSQPLELFDNELWKDTALNSSNDDGDIFNNTYGKPDDILSTGSNLYWSPETSDWETFRSQLNAKSSSEMNTENSPTDASSAFPSSPWGENPSELKPKMATGWATFDSSFGLSMTTNGDTTIFDEMLFDDDKANMKDITPPFESSENPTSPLENLTHSQSNNQEVLDKMDDELLVVTSSSSLPEQLPDIELLENNSLVSNGKDLPQVPIVSNTLDVSETENSLTSNVKDLPQVPVISNIPDVSVTDNSPTVNSVDS